MNSSRTTKSDITRQWLADRIPDENGKVSVPHEEIKAGAIHNLDIMGHVIIYGSNHNKAASRRMIRREGEALGMFFSPQVKAKVLFQDSASKESVSEMLDLVSHPEQCRSAVNHQARLDEMEHTLADILVKNDEFDTEQEALAFVKDERKKLEARKEGKRLEAPSIQFCEYCEEEFSGTDEIPVLGHCPKCQAHYPLSQVECSNCYVANLIPLRLKA